MHKPYRVTEDFAIPGRNNVKGERIEMSPEDAQTFIDRGLLQELETKKAIASNIKKINTEKEG